jgi:FixJ family two-component response regulator
VVFVVDDDPSVRKSLARLLGSAGYRTESFASAQEFLARGTDSGPACLVLDLQLPGPSGLDLQESLASSGAPLPIVFITGHGDIPASVKAMKGGAVDFLPKPFQAEALLGAVSKALERDAAARRERAESSALASRIRALTPRERQVFALVATGKLNKQIAAELGTSEKTVKVHRGRVMQKLSVSSLAELVRLADRAGVELSDKA